MASISSILGNGTANITTDCTAIFCYPTSKSGQNIVTGLYLDLALGALFLIGFVLWRGSFPIYQARMYIAKKQWRPALMPLKGHRRLWSWLVPPFTVSDSELLRQAGLDAVASLRIIEYGILVLAPLTVLGVAVLIPVNYTNSASEIVSGSRLDSAFLRMTMSNIPKDSGRLWVPFVYVILFVAWASFLLVRYHKAHLSLAMWHEFHPESEVVKGHSSQEEAGDSPVGNGSAAPPPAPASSDASAGGVSVTLADPEAGLLSRRTASHIDSRVVPSVLPGAPPVALGGPECVLTVRGQPYGVPRVGRYAVLILDDAEERYHFSGEGVLPGVSVLSRRRRGWPASYAVSAGRVFGEVFADDFVAVVPVYDCRAVDKLLHRRFGLVRRLERSRAALQAHEAGEPGDGAPAPTPRRRKRRDARLAKLTAAATQLEDELRAVLLEVETAKRRTLERPPTGPFFAVFRTQEAAAFAAGVNVNPPDQHLMRVLPSPDPADINWVALLRGWKQRMVRPLLVFPVIMVIMLFPIGIFTGAFSQLSTAICGVPAGDADLTTYATSWFCSDERLARFLRNLLTGFLPSLLLSLYQVLVLPLAFYLVAQAEATSFSLEDLDYRCGELFFYWNVFNLFLGALLGGSVLSSIQTFLERPSNIWPLLGNAIPASSNFFVLYVMFRGFALVPFRLFWPAASVFVFILKWLRIISYGYGGMPTGESHASAALTKDIACPAATGAKVPIDKAMEIPARNLRYSRDIGVIVMAIYVAVFAYAPITPFILPFGLIYFSLMWIVWRYQALYVYESVTNAQGRIWPYFAHRLVACLLIQVIFTSAMFIVKGGYVQAGILLAVLSLSLYGLRRYLKLLDRKGGIQTLRSKHLAGRVDPPLDLFTAPPLRSDADSVWYPEWGKAWQYWGVPRYGF
ncbi:putative membrane protein C2G11.09 [Auxenochlorella protothecoides]|uniref:Putative membrane protein C2G11.09 n=1 Tax=Auxenochlorella protothecoides TaxID=3075 RepID=A0A087SSA7_AUXPR|nr:putative membrane protein C2G11.09 [Auxenochlorella protothecoides]KFM28611.1 putative membrane protein C2G11.09 [Auxenochlorella protothecoides]